MRGCFDSRWINAAVKEVVIRIHDKVVVHPRMIEKVVGIAAMMKMVKRMMVAKMIKVAEREALRSQVEVKIKAHARAPVCPA